MRFVDKLIHRLKPPPFPARHLEYSLIVSIDDDPSGPSDRLLDLALEAVRNARGVSLEDLCRRMKRPPHYPRVWPGEHYRLLTGLVTALRPRVIVEVGTYTGLSALAMLQALPAGGRLHTFDLVDWRSHPDCVLTEDDFRDVRLVRHLDDLGDPAVFTRHAPMLREADLFFVDAAKDGVFERRLLDHLRTVPFPGRPILVFDDIRLWNMLKTWREICEPKLDLTSFGHWSGTGLVELTQAK